MRSAQSLAACAAEKRLLNPDYQASLAELKAVDVVLRKRSFLALLQSRF